MRLKFIFAILLLSVGLITGASRDNCNPRNIDGDATRIVCVCNEDSCPDLQFDWPQRKKDGLVVTSSLSGKRFDVRKLGEVQLTDSNPTHTLEVRLEKEHQTVRGWGGAITDAAGINHNKLPELLGDKLVESYYGRLGLQYNFGRVPLAGADFSPRAYSYDDTPNDVELRDWALAPEDIVAKIPLIQKAKRYIASTDQGELKLFSSPWSPPAWMKDNNNLTRGHLLDDDKIYASYAEYMMKFYDAYEKRGVSFWGATIQNEPYSANSEGYYFNSLQFEAEQMSKFVSKFLGPALEARGKTRENFKLMVGDDNLGLINERMKTIMDKPEVAKYISGLAFHWYASGWNQNYDKLTEVYEQIGDKIDFILMTEACEGWLPDEQHVSLGNWTRAETYATDIIEDFKRLTNGWIDWNLALDMQGGPNWVNNFVDSPIIINPEKREFYKQPMYYALGHFSRFFRPGFIVVDCKLTAEGKQMTDSDLVMAIAAKSPKFSYVVVTILNKSSSARVVNLSIDELSLAQGGVPLALEQHSITSVIIKT